MLEARGNWWKTGGKTVDTYPVYKNNVAKKKDGEGSKQWSSRLFGGQNLFNFLLRYLFCLGLFGRHG